MDPGGVRSRPLPGENRPGGKSPGGRCGAAVSYRNAWSPEERHMRPAVVLSLAGVLLLNSSTRAADARDLDAATARGVKALRALQRDDGTWPHQEIGATALAGLTLLECGAAADDPAVAKAAKAVRATCPTLTHTYSVALA